MLLDKTASVWRTKSVGSSGQLQLAKTFASIKCAIVPISSFDSAQSYSYESTHVLFCGNWLLLRKEDEVRWGRRLPDPFGNVQPWVFVLNGRRSFTALGPAQVAYYCREKD